MNKDKILAAVIAMAIASAGFAYASDNNKEVVYLFAWAIGTAASILIQYLWYRKPASQAVLTVITLLLAVAAGADMYYAAFVF